MDGQKNLSSSGALIGLAILAALQFVATIDANNILPSQPPQNSA
jgi:hypothetical protein